MGLFDLFRAEKKMVKINKDEPKWIDLSLIVFFDNRFSKKQISEMAKDMLKIILDTQNIYNSKGELIGSINSYLGIKPVLEKVPKDATFMKPQKLFVSEIEECDPVVGGRKWKISLKPKKGKDYLYSFSEYFYDLGIVFAVGNWILKKYGSGGMGTPSTFSPIFINGKPALEQIEQLSIVRYLVEDRLKYTGKENKTLERQCLGYSVEEKFKEIKSWLNTSNEKDGDRKWLSQVEELLKKWQK